MEDDKTLPGLVSFTSNSRFYNRKTCIFSFNSFTGVHM